MRLLLLTLLITTTSLLSTLVSQSSLIHRDHEYNHIVDRTDILYPTDNNLHTSQRRYSYNLIAEIAATLDSTVLTSKDESDRQQLLRATKSISDFPEKEGFLKNFYRNPTQLYQFETKDFSFSINPILDIRVGQQSEDSKFIFNNGRGIEFHGQLDNKIYFHTSFLETQSNFLNYQDPFIETNKALRGRSNYKDYQSSVFDNLSGYDHGLATAYLGIKISKHTLLELGHDRHFIGNGMRSLLLDDQGANYFYLKFDVKVWKLHYQTLLAELSTISARYTPNNDLLPKKYMATHYLSFKPRNNMEIGFFESIVFSRENNFEFHYLNPVIFYRTVEFQLDSPDNVLLGLNGKWDLFNRISLYGQILLDELKFGELFSSEKWWGNKYGIQLGLKYFNLLGIDHLDTQIEMNGVRPYTYTHREATEAFPEISIANYSHYNQPLAHPLGANFSELIWKLKYKATEKLFIGFRLLYTKVGRDNNGNYGSNILTPNGTRIAEYGIEQNQGALSTIKIIDLTASYELITGLYLDLQYLNRSDSNGALGSTITSYFGTGLRYNIAQRRIDY